ncbi:MULTISPECIES: transposase [Alteromonas]|jgi:putative transposase|uniref:Transposase n=1 Tax=Alteromonas stellipolaris TaxID=233316 RepID=A0AAW7Z2U4_9ALTE|nr:MULTISPECIES: transposase [Alteromonas]AMJ91142.1 transposase [Alteromonas sp. Mac2]ALM90094.1 Mobile element protein [Alteromonas stellipolaris LMG 21856]AMJ74866.1 transposase [Alteromonas stellipolaris]AMJ87280.1 transposase [Alteromonas sp. Mac1]ANB22009.1 transposase [Alteromonas stellipolaris]
MPRPRKSLISLQDTPYYHCVSRCVRRAFLCGEDHYSGKSYEHRRQWVEDRLLTLANAFAINICAYAVMSNHTHVVLHVDRDEALAWSTEEVLSRWHSLHKGTELTRQYKITEQRMLMSEAQIQAVISTANIYRQRLYDISWFMRLLNEYIARLANKEDDCTGRFWEGRFKSQSLLDEAALAACMAYVDLNPLRVGLAKTPETSDFTSIQKRITAAKKSAQPNFLLPFTNSVSSTVKGLPFKLKDYLELVDNTGRHIVANKTGSIDHSYSPILVRTGLQHIDWQSMVMGIENQFSTSISLTIAIGIGIGKTQKLKLA